MGKLFLSLYLSATAIDHASDLRDACRLVGSVLPIVYQRTLEIVEGCEPFFPKDMYKSYSVKGIRLFVGTAECQHFIVERQGFAVLLQVEMAFGVDIIIERALLWRKGMESGNDRIEILGGLGIVPFIVIAYADICPETRVEFVFSVEFPEEKQCLMVFLALKIL